MIKWNKENTPAELHAMLNELGKYYSITESSDSNVAFIKEDSQAIHCSTKKENDGWIIKYTTITTAARAIGSVLSGLETDETTSFKNLGVMLDCSRNKVFNLDYLKGWLRQMALMGNNLVMLYTEDTYELEGEPFFGYMRGRFTFDEVRELDDYAFNLGIELRACFQTLGHLEQMLHWPYYRHSIADTPSVMNVSKPRVYELITKMIDFWSKALRTRKIHIGMDETQDLGRGSFMNVNGYVPPFKLFCEHLAKVRDICAEKGLSPEMWSDMFYRFSNEKHEYYTENPEIKEEIKAVIPTGVKMWYWDYYHQEQHVYETMLKSHREVNNGNVSLASGIWTWAKFWCESRQNRNVIYPTMRACRSMGVDELVFTMWGDDGGFCVYDSALPNLAMASDLAYGVSEEAIDESASIRTEAICGMDYNAIMKAGENEMWVRYDNDQKFVCPRMSAILWDDPLQGLYYSSLTGDNNTEVIPLIIERLTMLADVVKASTKFETALHLQIVEALYRLLTAKLQFRTKLIEAYDSGDKAALKEIAEAAIPCIIAMHDKFAELYRKDWLTNCKPFGFEVMQIRNAGVRARYEETARLINEYLAGEINEIAELKCRGHFSDTFWYGGGYRQVCSASTIS